MIALSGCQPAEYAKQPPKRFQGDRLVRVSFVASDRVADVCKLLGADVVSLACAKGDLIILPNPCKWPNDSDYRQLACHELGHPNGWPASHGP